MMALIGLDGWRSHGIGPVKLASSPLLLRAEKSPIRLLEASAGFSGVKEFLTRMSFTSSFRTERRLGATVNGIADLRMYGIATRSAEILF